MLPLNALLRRIPITWSSVGVLALLVLAALGAHSWLAAHDAAVRLSATLEAQRRVLDDAAERQRQRDAELAKTLSAIQQAKRRVNTPAQAAAEIPQLLPPLPAPVTIDLPTPTAETPEPPAEARVPQTDLKPIYDYLQDCRVCQASLGTLRDDLADERTKVAALTVERDAAVRAARGGGFWSHVRRGAKWFLIGGAVGALAATASRH